MNNIILIGMRATGKSTIGAAIAKKISYHFCDTDKLIEDRCGTSIAQCVADKGWEAFRSVEADVVRDVAEQERTVIATGGGVVLSEDNVDALRASGKIFLLTAPLATLARRIEESSDTHRPALTDAHSVLDDLTQTWQEREQLYHAAAHEVIDTENFATLEDVAAHIASSVKE